MFKASLRVLGALVAMLSFTTFASAQGTYTVRSGDTLQIEVLEDSALNRSALVLPGGGINFPFAGNVAAAGRSTGAIASELASKLAPNFTSAPTVFVSVAEVGVPTGTFTAPTTDIYITGEIANPGLLEGARGVTILQAIAQGGGLTRFAAGKRIELRRGDKIYPYNYFTNGGQGSIPGHTRLAPGDVIVVPQRTLFE